MNNYRSLFLLAIFTLSLTCSANSETQSTGEQKIKTLENLLSTRFRPTAEQSYFMKEFKEVGCDSSVSANIVTKEEIPSKVFSLISENSEITGALIKENSGRSKFILARLLELGWTANKSFGILDKETLMSQSAKLGYGDALYNQIEIIDVYSNVLIDSDEIRRKFDLMQEKLIIAAQNGSAAAANKLAYTTQSYIESLVHGTPDLNLPNKSRTEERLWSCHAAKLGDAEGQESCASHLASGIGGDVNTAEANDLLDLACSQGHEYSCYQIAQKYEYGQDQLKVNLVLAKERYCRAIYFGNQGSHTPLAGDNFRELRPKQNLLSKIPKPTNLAPQYNREDILNLLDRWYEPRYADVDKLKKLSCSQELIKKSEEEKADLEIGISRDVKRKKQVLDQLSNEQIFSHLAHSENLLDLYIAARLIEDGYFVAPSGISPLDFYELADSRGHIRSKIKLLGAKLVQFRQRQLTGKELALAVQALVEKVQEEDSDLMGYLLIRIDSENSTIYDSTQRPIKDPYLQELNRYSRKFVCSNTSRRSPFLLGECAGMLLEGKLGPRDTSLGKLYLQQAAELGESYALFRVENSQFSESCEDESCTDKNKKDLQCLLAKYGGTSAGSSSNPDFRFY